MQTFLTKLRLIFEDKSLRNRVLFVIFVLALFRLGAAIPIPGVNQAELGRFFQGNQFLGLLNLFSGGGLSNLSIVMLGVGPFITASIIMQLMGMVLPALKEMYQESGEAGRKKFAQHSRLLSIPLAMLQGFGLLTLLARQGILGQLSTFDQIINVLVVTAGSIILMWIGELISEFGIGNGLSLIIFAGIVAQLPTTLSQLIYQFDISQIVTYLAFIIIAIIIVAGVVVVNEAERPVPVTYAKRVRGMKVYGGQSTYLPLRLNQAGVIPIIFALSILLFPQMIATFLSGVNIEIIKTISGLITKFLANTLVYGSAYFVLVFLFTYFYTAVTFDPVKISENLQKNGAFIPGTRPGVPTSEYLSRIVTRITAFGALFLGVIAILPIILQAATGQQSLAIGGTALLIVVSVVLELVKQLNAQLAMREY